MIHNVQEDAVSSAPNGVFIRVNMEKAMAGLDKSNVIKCNVWMVHCTNMKNNVLKLPL